MDYRLQYEWWWHSSVTFSRFGCDARSVQPCCCGKNKGQRGRDRGVGADCTRDVVRKSEEYYAKGGVGGGNHSRSAVVVKPIFCEQPYVCSTSYGSDTARVHHVVGLEGTCALALLPMERLKASLRSHRDERISVEHTVVEVSTHGGCGMFTTSVGLHGSRYVFKRVRGWLMIAPVLLWRMLMLCVHQSRHAVHSDDG
jgi:hypothetical protein